MNIRNKFPIDHFIKKFEAIPEAKWHIGEFRNPSDISCRCALGHCGMFINEEGDEETTEEAQALVWWAGRKSLGIACINDGDYGEYSAATPKKRVLDFLRDLKHEEAVIIEEAGRR